MADSWGGEETQINKIGTSIVVVPAVIAAFLLARIVSVDVSTLALCIVVAILGVVGGAMNVAGRGPIAAGAVVGLVIALGGFGAVYWWIQGKLSVRSYEVAIAFVIGVLPGFALQYGMSRMFAKPVEAEE